MHSAVFDSITPQWAAFFWDLAATATYFNPAIWDLLDKFLYFLGRIRHSGESTGWGSRQLAYLERYRCSLDGTQEICPISTYCMEEQSLQLGNLARDISLYHLQHIPNCWVCNLCGSILTGTRTPNRRTTLERAGPLGQSKIKLFVGDCSETYRPRSSSAFNRATFVRLKRASDTLEVISVVVMKMPPMSV